MPFLPPNQQRQSTEGTCHHYQVINPRPATDGVTSPRLPHPSASCCCCCIHLCVLGKTLSKQLQQQAMDFPLSEPDERLMKLPGITNSSSGFTLVANKVYAFVADANRLTFSSHMSVVCCVYCMGHMQVCTSLHHSVFYRPDALPATQPTASKH